MIKCPVITAEHTRSNNLLIHKGELLRVITFLFIHFFVFFFYNFTWRQQFLFIICTFYIILIFIFILILIFFQFQFLFFCFSLKTAACIVIVVYDDTELYHAQNNSKDHLWISIMDWICSDLMLDGPHSGFEIYIFFAICCW